jgi:hypothetical protein
LRELLRALPAAAREALAQQRQRMAAQRQAAGLVVERDRFMFPGWVIVRMQVGRT